MKKLIALMLALCLCAACFAAFAEEKKDEAKPEEKIEEKAEDAAETEGSDEADEADGEELEAEVADAIETIQAYRSIYLAFEELGLKDNDLYEKVSKVIAPLFALSDYFEKNGTDVTDPAELEKVDELKEYADFFEGKTDLDPELGIGALLFLGNLKENVLEELGEFSFSDAVLQFSIALDMLGDDIENSDAVEFFKSILEYAKGIGSEDVKAFIASEEEYIKGVLEDSELKKLYIDGVKLLSGIKSDKLKEYEEGIKAAIDDLGTKLKDVGKSLEEAVVKVVSGILPEADKDAAEDEESEKDA